MKEIKGKLKGEFSSLILDASTITVTATTQDGAEKELIFPDNIPSKEIVTSLAYELGEDLKSFSKQIVENVEITKTYWQEIEFGIPWLGGLKLRISRAPKKVVKSFTGKGVKIDPL
jgi:hypothetical protein